MNQEWHNQTLYLYLICILFINVFAILSCKKKKVKSEKIEVEINKILYIISFSIAWILLAFATCGADYPVYRNMFLYSSDLNIVIQSFGIEPGFAFLNYIIRLFTTNKNIYFGIISFLFLYFIYKGLYNYKDMISPAWGTFVFTTVLFLQQINLKRIYLAAAVVFWGTRYLIEKKHIKYFAVIMCCALIHYSAVVMFVPLIYDLTVNEKISKRMVLIISIFTIGTLYAFRNIIFGYVLLQRYSGYGVQQGGFGFLQIAYHVPILISLIRYKADEKTQRYRDIAFIYAILSLVIGMTGYFVVMIGRAFVYFYFALVMAPALSCARTNFESKPASIMVIDSKSVWSIIYIGYFIIRLILYMNSYLFYDQIMPYTDIFNNVF